MPWVIRSSLWDKSWALIQALLLHIGVVVFIYFGTTWQSKAREIPPPKMIIQATLVGDQLNHNRRDKQAAERTAKNRRKRQIAKDRIEKKRREEQQNKRETEKKRQELKKRNALKAAELIKREQQNKALKKKRDEKEKQLVDIRQQREKAEKQRKLEEQRLAQLEQQRIANDKKQLAKLEKQRLDQLIAYEANQQQQAQLATLEQQYIAVLQATITSRWKRPPSVMQIDCKVQISQIPGGEVINVAIMSPCRTDEITKRTIVAAVNRSSPLPYRGFEKVFSRQIILNFRHPQ